jgi:hypothetical protein
MKSIMSSQGPAIVGKQFVVNVNILTLINQAFIIAQNRGYLINSNWEDMYIGATNLGWEISGTYDATVDINSFKIKYF